MEQVQKKDVMSNQEESIIDDLDSDERVDSSNLKLEELQSLDSKAPTSKQTKSMVNQENSPSDEENEENQTAEFKKNSNI